MRRYKIIAAMDLCRGIGFCGQIPWKPDYYFLKKTLGHRVLVGKNTKLPKLPNREVIVADHRDSDKNVDYVIGGAKIYQNYINCAKRIYLTIIDGIYHCDTYFPEIPVHFKLIKRKIKQNFIVEVYDNIQIDFQYFKLCKNILNTSNTMQGVVYQFNINLIGNLVPIISSKKIFLRGVIEELLFFLRGDTDTTILESRGVNIWRENTSREQLDKLGLNNLKTGEAGPIYGAQWIKQIPGCIVELIKNPQTRRCLFTAWIPSEISKMCLPPCHVTYQLYFIDNKLCMHMFQRSCDVFLGLPFNLASCAFMLIIFAKYLSIKTKTNITPHAVHISISHAHIYNEHINSVIKQLNQDVYTPAEVIFEPEYNDDILEYFNGLKYKNFSIKYNSSENIKANLII